jgi:hypothetical protein
MWRRSRRLREVSVHRRAEGRDPGPIHVHGLGINPKDGALFVATHTGLFRAGEGEPKATRVADRFQDTMGFTVVGPNRFLGSGHPEGHVRELLREDERAGQRARVGQAAGDRVAAAVWPKPTGISERGSKRSNWASSPGR